MSGKYGCIPFMLSLWKGGSARHNLVQGILPFLPRSDSSTVEGEMANDWSGELAGIVVVLACFTGCYPFLLDFNGLFSYFKPIFS